MTNTLVSHMTFVSQKKNASKEHCPYSIYTQVVRFAVA